MFLLTFEDLFEKLLLFCQVLVLACLDLVQELAKVVNADEVCDEILEEKLVALLEV